jgi:hypothetical protein
MRLAAELRLVFARALRASRSGHRFVQPFTGIKRLPRLWKSAGHGCPRTVEETVPTWLMNTSTLQHLFQQSPDRAPHAPGRQRESVANRPIPGQSRRVWRDGGLPRRPGGRLGSHDGSQRRCGPGCPAGAAVGCGAVVRRRAAGLRRAGRRGAKGIGSSLPLRRR